jgi:hypothetical protein
MTQRCTTLWGTGPALWTCAGRGGQHRDPGPRRSAVGGQLLGPVDDHDGADLGRRYVIHNPQALLPSLSEFKFFVRKDPV